MVSDTYRLGMVLVISGIFLLFTVLTARFYARRDPDAAGTVHRLRPGALLRSAAWLLPVAFVPVVSGAMCSIMSSSSTSGISGACSPRIFPITIAFVPICHSIWIALNPALSSHRQ